MSQEPQAEGLTLGKSLDNVRTVFEEALGEDALGAKVQDMLVVMRVNNEIRMHMSENLDDVASLLVQARTHQQWVDIEAKLATVPVGTRATVDYNMLGLKHQDIDRMVRLFSAAVNGFKEHGGDPRSTNARIDFHIAIAKIKEGLHFLEQSCDWLSSIPTTEPNDDQQR